MTMDYGSPSAGVCVVSGGDCDMGQSAMQAAYNLHDNWGVPYANIELTPMIGAERREQRAVHARRRRRDGELRPLAGPRGVHYWSYDRDTDCAAGAASATCNSMGNGYAGAHGYLKRFLAAGLH